MDLAELAIIFVGVLTVGTLYFSAFKLSEE